MTTVTDRDWVTGLDARMSSLEAEFRSFGDEIRTHYATKADVERLMWQLLAALIAVATVAVAAVKYLPGGTS